MPPPPWLETLAQTLAVADAAPAADTTPADLDAFGRWTQAIAARNTIAAALTIAIGGVLWWPLDLFVGVDGDYITAMGQMRLRSVLLCGGAVAILLASPCVRKHALPFGVIVYTLFLLSVGYAIGSFSTPGRPWLADAFLGLTVPTIQPMSLPWRVLTTLCLAAGLLGGFFIPHPHHLSDPWTPGQLSFLAGTVFISVVVGHLLHGVQRRSFLQARSLARAQEEIRELNQDLEARIELQTRELRELAHHLQGVQEQERERIARELHDGLGQELTALRYTTGALAQRAEGSPLHPLTHDLQSLVQRTATSARTLVRGLWPTELGMEGLRASIQVLADDLGCPAELAPLQRKPPPGVALAAYRIAQEALTNATRHAGGPTLLRLQVQGQTLRVVVEDAGPGMPDQPHKGYGLLSMRERARAVGGTLAFYARSGGGTAVVATLPLSQGTPT